MKRKISIRQSFFVLLSILVLFAQSSMVYANSDVQMAPTNVSLYQITNDLPILIGDQEVATMKANTVVFLEKDTNGDLYMQFGLDKLKVDSDKVSLLNPIPENISYYSYNESHSETLAYDTTTIATAQLASNTSTLFESKGSYPIYQKTNDTCSILIGNQIFTINTSNVSSSSSSTENNAVITNGTETYQVKTAVEPTTQTNSQSTVTIKMDTSTPSFTGVEKFFKANIDGISVYVNENGNNVKVGELVKDQEYIIQSQMDGWLKVKFGNVTGYVRKGDVVPSNGSSIKNKNNGTVSSNRMFRANRKLEIYDNTSGKLVTFGYVEQGRTYSIIKQTSANWLQVDFAGRLGYVYLPYVQMQVSKGDKFFKVVTSNTPVYVTRDNQNVIVGYLNSNQEYPINGLNGSFIQVKYGTGYGYVDLSATVPSNGSILKNLANSTIKNSSIQIKAKQTVSVYDNTSGKLVEFAKILANESYPIVKRSSADWIMVSIAGRVGYVRLSNVILPLSKSDTYFSTYYSKTPVYVNGQEVAYLGKDQEYPILKQEAGYVRIQYGATTALVRTSHVSAGSGKSIKNLNKDKLVTQRTIVPKEDVQVFTNTSGQLPFALLKQGISFPVVQDVSNDWYKVVVGGRIGYISKLKVQGIFNDADRYFQPLTDQVMAYDSLNTNVIVSELIKGQKYFIQSRSNGILQIAFGNKSAYVRESDVYPTNSSGINNVDSGLKNSDKAFTTERVVDVYDNTTNPMSVFAKLQPGQSYPVIKQTSTYWLQISLGGRIGYVYKPHVKIGPYKTYINTNYNLTLNDMLNIQMKTYPQTDKAYACYVFKDFITVDPKNPAKGVVNADSMNVRGGPDTSYWVIGTLSNGDSVNIIGQSGNWYQINYGVTWKNASPSDVSYYLNPSNFDRNSQYYFQFLKLSQPSGLNENEVNMKVLNGKGILAGKAGSFIAASQTYHINEVYLISHALLETGNGTSNLAKGILVSSVAGKPVTPKVVYNMFGIGAYDSAPDKYGSETAYTQGWFTPEAAIIGGAKFISEGYINNPYYRQDTLYKMRWNPSSPGGHQYATDIGWAYKQVTNISNIYSLLDQYDITFDTPVYSKQ